MNRGLRAAQIRGVEPFLECRTSEDGVRPRQQGTGLIQVVVRCPRHTLSLRIADQVALQMEQTAPIIGGYFAWRNLRVANESQVTDRFTKAIDQLGSERSDKDGKPVPNLEVWLGGIYAFERIARDSPRDDHGGAHRICAPECPASLSLSFGCC